MVSLYICPWSLEDPLCQSQTLPYLKRLNAAYGYRFALMTFENPLYATDSQRSEMLRIDLEKCGIHWFPTNFRPGISIFSKTIDTLNSIRLGLRICEELSPEIIHSRSSITNVTALTISKMKGLKFLYDSDSMLSREYADNGRWKKHSLGYMITAGAEALARRHASYIIVLSNLQKSIFRENYLLKTPIEVIPCCVETGKFKRDADLRAKLRSEFVQGDGKLLVYVGKVGGRYLVEEIFEFLLAAQKKFANLRLLIVSNENPEIFDKIAADKGVDRNSYFVRSARPEEVSGYLSAADAGLAFMRKVESERGSSPIKIAEYLSVGLPVIITDGVGDCSAMVENDSIGVVVNQDDESEFGDAFDKLESLWAEPPQSIALRCRRTAEREFSMREVGLTRYKKVYDRIRRTT